MLPLLPSRTALLLIDMQRDFLEPGGFGETLGNDVSLLQAAIEPCQRALAAARALLKHTDLDAEAIAREAMSVATRMSCVPSRKRSSASCRRF